MKLWKTIALFVICASNLIHCMEQGKTSVVIYTLQSNTSVSGSSQTVEYQKILSAKLVKAIENGDFEKIEKLVNERNANPFIPSDAGAIPYVVAQFYNPLDKSMPTRDEIISYFKSKFPEYENYELIITDDEEEW